MDSTHAKNSPILSGWKDIANYLGKGVRTVQRYESDMGLPIRRPAGKSGGSVIAKVGEIDAWVIACPSREEFGVSMPASNPFSANVKAMMNSVSEMRKCREELRALSAELRDFRNRLHDSIRLLRKTSSQILPKEPTAIQEGTNQTGTRGLTLLKATGPGPRRHAV